MTTFRAHGSFSGKNCFFCNSVANCRCLDCGPFMSLCESCAVDNHTNRNIFHHVEIFTDSKLYFPLKMQRVLICKDHQCSNGVHFRPVMIADTRGLQKEVHVQFCGCEPDFLRLLRFRLWGATPSKPELAFSINVMDLLHTLNLECQVAVKDFCDALQTMADDVIVFSNQRKLYPVIIDSLEEYRLLLYLHVYQGSITINLPPSTLLLTALALMMALYAQLVLRVKVLSWNQWMPCSLVAKRRQERVFEVLFLVISCLQMMTK